MEYNFNGYFMDEKNIMMAMIEFRQKEKAYRIVYLVTGFILGIVSVIGLNVIVKGFFIWVS